MTITEDSVSSDTYAAPQDWEVERAERDRLREQVANLQETLGTISRERNEYEARVTNLATELGAAQTERNEFEAQVVDLRTQITMLRDRVATLDIRAAELQPPETDASLRAQVAQAQQQVTALQRQVTEATESATRAGRHYSEAARELVRFKDQVVEVATRYAVENSWCSTVNQALQEMGLEMKPKSYSATLQITVEFVAEMAERRDIPSESWVRDSMQTDAIRRAIANSFSMDSDHAGVSVNDIEFEVTSVEENEEEE